MDIVRELLGRKPRLLIVDDEPDLCEIMADIIGRMNIDVETVNDGMTGLTRLKEHDFDLVIADIKMPGLTGTELMSRARALGLPAPFILITAYQSDTVLIDAIRLGAVEFLRKPFSEQQAVESAIRGLRISARERTIEQLIEAAGAGAATSAIDGLRRQIAMLRRLPPR